MRRFTKGTKFKTYEVWHFKDKTNDVFKDYVRKFTKIKMESSELKVVDIRVLMSTGQL